MSIPTAQAYDVVIIGSGQGGKPLAVATARAGKRTALIERHLVGGTCVNYGCTPTKTMYNSARVAYLSNRGDDFGVMAPEIRVDMRKVWQRKHAVVEQFRGASEKQVETTDNLDLIRGEARFTGPKELLVQKTNGGGLPVTAETIVIDVGTRPAVPPIDGIDDVPYLDSTSILEVKELPDHLVVIGGGYVGLEFGQMFHRFGSRVTIIQRGERLLSREDDDVSDAIKAILEEDGMAVHCKAEAKRADRIDDHTIRVTVATTDGETAIDCSHLLLAAGRLSNADSLDLDEASIATDNRGFIKVNKRLETNVDGVYAIGDVNGGPAFTHISYDDYRVLKANLLEGGRETTENRLVPSVVFLDPQLGRVGLNESESREQGKNIKVAELPMTHVARAIEMSETRGFMKVIIDADNDRILGCAILGVEGGEVMNMIQIAMMGELPYTALRDTPLAHPTMGESLNNLFATLKE